MAALGNQSPGETLHVRIISPELDFQSLIVFNSDDTVWMAKQKIISTMCKDLKDCLNYGLYCPSINNRAGKFLDEERLLKDYPLPGPIGLLEFKYKRRLYKMQVNPAKLKKLHSPSNLKKFMEIVYKGDADKVTELVNKGLDPNFYESGKKGEGGETPLTAAASLPRPRSVMLALVGGGAYLDFRNQRGATALHVGAELGNRDAIKTLLDLGASPNYKDARGLTALFDCVAVGGGTAQCVLMLLHDRAEICNRDENGWTEIHHCCMHGKVQHLEHLLFYGADMNAKTSTGDTALHVCARYNEEECARALMFRGADRTVKNADNEDAEQMARFAGHTKLAETIGKFRPEDVVLYSELPNYNEKRRGTISVATIRNLQRSRSNPQLHQLFTSDSNFTASLSSAGGYHVLTNGFLFKNQSSGNGGGSASISATLQSNREPATRTVLLQRDETGFGFVLRGAKSRTGADEKLVFSPSPECPALQYFDKVEAGSTSERAGLMSGDFLLEVNGENVTRASHDYTVSLIKNSGNLVTLKVVTLKVVTPDRQPRRESAASSQASNTSAKFSNPPSFSPSTGSQTKAKIAGLLELERLDATLDQYENEGHQSPSGTFKEPAPDYEEEDDVPGSSIPPPPPTANECRKATADEYDNDAEESSSVASSSSSSTFASMIKQATIGRDRRAKEIRISIQDDGFRSPPGSTPRFSVVESGPSPAPPPAPPPPPPPPPPVPAPSPAGVPGRTGMPSEVRRTLDENRRRDEAHAVLMAAVLKRRILLEGGGPSAGADGDGHQGDQMGTVGGSENRLQQQKSRKVQVVYGSVDRRNGSAVQSGVAAAKVNGSHVEAAAEGEKLNGSSVDRVARRFQAPNHLGTTTGATSSPGGNGSGNTSWRPVTSSALATVSNGRSSSSSSQRNSAAESSLNLHGNGGDGVSRPSNMSRISSPSASAAVGSSSQPIHPPPRGQSNQSHSLLDLSRLPEGVVGVTAPFLPPPEEFSGVVDDGSKERGDVQQGGYDAVPVSATLRSVAKNPVGNSTKFPARVQPDNSNNTSNNSNNGTESVFAGRAIYAWSVADVADFLDSLDYGAYRERFAAMRVDGKRLAEVKDPDLVTLGVENVLHRIKLSREIRKFLQGNRLPS